ncbi:hypothetical protein PR048_014013 [Dryococelus australis]|uniref:Uncharacterized protein n=1 Tax=Dryococelus australis TaxID=614101 RepID=A0ABQ9HU35_9NEOP|nr:hypothetical protein PR048_014013 [Dryococelus australis]
MQYSLFQSGSAASLWSTTVVPVGGEGTSFTQPLHKCGKNARHYARWRPQHSKAGRPRTLLLMFSMAKALLLSGPTRHRTSTNFTLQYVIVIVRGNDIICCIIQVPPAVQGPVSPGFDEVHFASCNRNLSPKTHICCIIQESYLSSAQIPIVRNVLEISEHPSHSWHSTCRVSRPIVHLHHKHFICRHRYPSLHHMYSNTALQPDCFYKEMPTFQLRAVTPVRSGINHSRAPGNGIMSGSAWGEGRVVVGYPPPPPRAWSTARNNSKKEYAEIRCQWLYYSPPTKANRVRFPAGRPRIFARGTRAGRLRWSAGFLGDFPFPPHFYSGAAPYSTRITHIDSQEIMPVVSVSHPSVIRPSVSQPNESQPDFVRPASLHCYKLTKTKLFSPLSSLSRSLGNGSTVSIPLCGALSRPPAVLYRTRIASGRGWFDNTHSFPRPPQYLLAPLALLEE